MKKFLLSLVATMTAVCGAFAQTTITASQISLDKATTVGGFTVAVAKNDGATAPGLYSGVLRLYAKNTLTVSGEKVTKVVVALATTGAKRYTTFTPSVGALSATQVAGDTEITWNGDATTVTFTVGEKATMGTDGDTKAGQVHISEITIYGEGGGTVEPDPDPTPDPTPGPVETVGDGTEAKPYTVADVIALNNTKSGSAWVKGYIVGAMNSNNNYVFETTAPFSMATNVYIADTTTETEEAKMVPVQLVSGSEIRKAVNLLDNPDNLGKELTIQGSLEKYFSQPGVKSPTAYKLNGEGGGTTPVDPTPGVPTTGPGSADQPYTIAEAIAKNNDQSLGWVNGYIIGVMLFNEETKANYFSTEVNGQATNIVIAASATETEISNMIAVQLPAGSKVRTDLNLVDRPGNMGKEVSVCGSLEKYCGIAGVRNTSDYTIVGGIAPIPVEETASLTSFVEEQSESNLKITGTVTVYYQSPDKKYTFITDGETNLEVYGSLPEYHNGDQLTGIVGKYGFYQNMPQMTPQVDSFGEATAGTPIEPTEVAFNQIQIAQYVKVIAIEIYEEDGKFYIGQGDAKRQIFDRFSIGGIKAGVCTITGIGAIYGTTVQLFPIELDYKNVNNIAEISAESAKSQIFDLQGRKVSKAANGLYIVNGKKTFIR